MLGELLMNFIESMLILADIGFFWCSLLNEILNFCVLEDYREHIGRLEVLSSEVVIAQTIEHVMQIMQCYPWTCTGQTKSELAT